MCHLPPIVHTLRYFEFPFFDSFRRIISGGKFPSARWAIYLTKEHDGWTANTLTSWLHEITTALHERPPSGFSRTSHSLRKGAATVAYNVGVTLYKIEYFGGRSTESSVAVDYIDPNALA
jgi:hypothetical protein